MACTASRAATGVVTPSRRPPTLLLWIAAATLHRHVATERRLRRLGLVRGPHQHRTGHRDSVGIEQRVGIGRRKPTVART